MDTRRQALYDSVPRGERVLSHSQIQLADDCLRAWFFKYVLKLKEAQRASREFGTCLHGVVERYLAAGPTGIVPAKKEIWQHAPLYQQYHGMYIEGPFEGQRAGDPVELYPEGWSKGVPPEHAHSIKLLIKEAIDAGHLRHVRMGEAELGFVDPLVEGASLVGFIDYASIGEGRMEDCKTSKSTQVVLGLQGFVRRPSALDLRALDGPEEREGQAAGRDRGCPRTILQGPS